MLVSQRITQHKNVLSSVLRLYSTASPLKKTFLYDFHVKHKGNMVPFAGWYMPVLYKDKSIIEVHKHCRTDACLFDVGHMGQLKFCSFEILFLMLLTIFAKESSVMTVINSLKVWFLEIFWI